MIGRPIIPDATRPADRFAQPNPARVQHRLLLIQECPVETTTPKPGILQAYAVLTLISGIFNLLWALYLGGVTCMGAVATLGIGMICMPLAAYPLVLGILEICQFNPLHRNPPTRQSFPTWLAIMQIIGVALGNPISLTAGIIGLVAGNDAAVKQHLGA